MRKILIGLAAAAALLAGSASAASAGTTPSPSAPTVSPNFGYNPSPTPTPTPRPVFRNWQWDVQDSSIGGINVNNVEGQGAIPMVAWLNTNIGSTFSRFSLLGNSVTLRHPALPFPTINLSTCTVDFVQNAPFRIVNGTGTAAGAISRNGQFVLNGLISYPYVKRGYYGAQVCPLRFVNVFTLLYAIRNNLPVPGLPTPTFVDFSVQGDALVAVPLAVPTPPIVTPTPYPTKTKTYAPVVSGSST